MKQENHSKINQIIDKTKAQYNRSHMSASEFTEVKITNLNSLKERQTLKLKLDK